MPAAVHGRQVRACVTGRAALEERGAAEQGIQLAVAAARPVAEMRGAMKSTDDFISWRDEIQTAHSWFGLGGRAHQHLASDAGHVSFLAYVDEMRLLDQVLFCHRPRVVSDPARNTHG